MGSKDRAPRGRLTATPWLERCGRVPARTTKPMSQAVWAGRLQMGLLQVIEDAPGYLKATFQGPQGSGKTRTAVELATKTHEFFRSTKPIAFYDTESGSDYIADLIAERTGKKPLRVKTRAFSD